MSLSAASFVVRTLDELVIDDEPSFRHVGLYADLKAVLTRSRYGFRVLPTSHAGRWDRALFLNLTFWGEGGTSAPRERGDGDILESEHIPADVVAHVAWHHLASRAFRPGAGERPSARALFMGEAIASAFDVYLVGRLLGHAPRSSFLETQVPAMADAAAKGKPVEQLTVADLGIDPASVGAAGSREEIVSVTPAEQRQSGEIVIDEGDAHERIVAFLAQLKVI